MPIAVNASRPWQWRSVSHSSGGVRTRYQYLDLRLTRRERNVESGRLERAPAPACSFAALWKVAIARGAPAEAVATIEYDASGYRFEIRGSALSLRFGQDCGARERLR